MILLMTVKCEKNIIIRDLCFKGGGEGVLSMGRISSNIIVVAQSHDA
jgi:hypothetical protein